MLQSGIILKLFKITNDIKINIKKAINDYFRNIAKDCFISDKLFVTNKIILNYNYIYG
jgi:hypothetical protein